MWVHVIVRALTMQGKNFFPIVAGVWMLYYLFPVESGSGASSLALDTLHPLQTIGTPSSLLTVSSKNTDTLPRLPQSEGFIPLNFIHSNGDGTIIQARGVVVVCALSIQQMLGGEKHDLCHRHTWRNPSGLAFSQAGVILLFQINRSKPYDQASQKDWHGEAFKSKDIAEVIKLPHVHSHLEAAFPAHWTVTP